MTRNIQLLLHFRWSNLVKARQYLPVFTMSNEFIYFFGRWKK